MMRWLTTRTLLFISLVFGQSLLYAQEQQQQQQQQLPTWQERYRFGEMTSQAPLRIDGLSNQMVIGFGGRYDRVVERAQLVLNYQTSPAIADTVTQVRVLVNNEIAGVVPLSAATANSRQQMKIALEPRVFNQYNEIRFELLGELKNGQCTSASTSVWFELLRDSYVDLTYKQLRVANDLAYFPEPWFDRNDFTELQLNLVMSPEASARELETHGILASFFGAQADWRNVEIDVTRFQTDAPQWDEDWRQRWPQGHAIIALENGVRPWALRELADVQQAQVKVIDNPAYPAYKLLVLQAPNEFSLRSTAATLVTHFKGLSGASAKVDIQPILPREAYQAPRWVAVDRPVTFAELVDHPSELQRDSTNPTPVQLELRLPPDLFTWQKYGIPVDLKFRYTPPVIRDESRLLVSVNGEFIKGFTLGEAGTENTAERVRVPLVLDSLLADDNVNIPAFKLGAVNQLQFRFSFGNTSDACKTRPLMNAQGVIEGNSTINLQGYDHYVAMPDVHLFAKTGYPFTRWDDLSQTIVIVPEQANDDIVTTLFLALAKTSAASGYPATHVRLRTVAELQPDEFDNDIMIVGQQALGAWLVKFGDTNLQQQFDGRAIAGQEKLIYAPEVVLQNSGPSAAVVSFASPLAEKRTVVALTATTDSYLARIRDAFNDAALSNEFEGFMSVLTPAKVAGFSVTQPYYVGTLSWWNRVVYHTSQYPVLITLFALLAIVVLALGLYRYFARLARRRNEA